MLVAAAKNEIDFMFKIILRDYQNLSYVSFVYSSCTSLLTTTPIEWRPL